MHAYNIQYNTVNIPPYLRFSWGHATWNSRSHVDIDFLNFLSLRTPRNVSAGMLALRSSYIGYDVTVDVVTSCGREHYNFIRTTQCHDGCSLDVLVANKVQTSGNDLVLAERAAVQLMNLPTPTAACSQDELPGLNPSHRTSYSQLTGVTDCWSITRRPHRDALRYRMT